MADYKITIPITKSDTDGKWLIKGRASGLGVDQESQVMRPAGIERLAKRINETPVPFRDTHMKNSILNELGVVTKATVSPDFGLDIEVELDKKHPSSKWLWESLDDGKQFGMSVHGQSNDFKVEQENGKPVLAIYDVEIDEVSVTTRPMWSPSFGTVIKKSIDEETHKSVEEVVNMPPEDNAVVEEVVVEEVVEEVTSAPEIVTEPETVEVAKAVTTDTAKEAKKLAKLASLVAQTNAVLLELGIVLPAAEETVTDSAVVTEIPVEKSEVDETPDRISQIEAQLQEATETIEILKSQIPSTPVPGVLVRKSAIDELQESFNSMDPSSRMRAALAALHNETEKLR
jgi:hypothetical protein